MRSRGSIQWVSRRRETLRRCGLGVSSPRGHGQSLDGYRPVSGIASWCSAVASTSATRGLEERPPCSSAMQTPAPAPSFLAMIRDPPVTPIGRIERESTGSTAVDVHHPQLTVADENDAGAVGGEGRAQRHDGHLPHYLRACRHAAGEEELPVDRDQHAISGFRPAVCVIPPSRSRCRSRRSASSGFTSASVVPPPGARARTRRPPAPVSSAQRERTRSPASLSRNVSSCESREGGALRTSECARPRIPRHRIESQPPAGSHTSSCWPTKKTTHLSLAPPLSASVLHFRPPRCLKILLLDHSHHTS